MSWLRRTSFALALGGAIVACTLIDPLDDVSGGAPKNSGKKDAASSASSSSSGAAGDDDDAATVTTTSSSSGSTASVCPGQKEHEPNDAAGQESPLSSSQVTSCGTLQGGAADVDRWKFTNTTGHSIQITVTIDAPSDVRVTLEAGGSQATSNAGATNISSLAAGESLTLTLTAPTGATQDIAYQIFFTGG
jgi:hypothetical protein